MPETIDQITEFRTIVETVIANQVEKSLSEGRRWPDYDKLARVGDLSYVSVEPKDGRPGAIGLGEEHCWGIVVRSQRIVNYSGSLALVSQAGQDDHITRRWAFDGPILPISIDTERHISTHNELASALEWARSPHLYPVNLEELARLEGDELDKIQSEYADANEKSIQLREDLQNIVKAQRKAWQNSHKLIIG